MGRATTHLKIKNIQLGQVANISMVFAYERADHTSDPLPARQLLQLPLLSNMGSTTHQEETLILEHITQSFRYAKAQLRQAGNLKLVERASELVRCDFKNFQS
ncbi:hypothetical protein E4U57_003837 [Claviceps arundinis]|uniref:Uncharacterized protein n=1 Tax=Claviceps arundinis TaxID=1623583 RepID=A0A9P7N0K9_9HYPO|nr:hypothetical protein E4U57_003837 [Claviceps arundinis]KAG5978090.1 hypothetical protein E4U56_005569 [Claviceps arundinis]